jgi:hypothetical protein
MRSRGAYIQVIGELNSTEWLISGTPLQRLTSSLTGDGIKLTNLDPTIPNAPASASLLQNILGLRALLTLFHACAAADLRKFPEIVKGLREVDYRGAARKVNHHSECFEIQATDIQKCIDQVRRLASLSGDIIMTPLTDRSQW